MDLPTLSSLALMSMCRRRTTARSVATRRGAALYVAVMATALMVTLLGLAGLVKVQIQRREATELADRIAAREAANGAAGLALINIAADNNWRTNYASGVESTPLAIGGARGATVSWALSDSDGDLTNRDVRLRLSGIGRIGDVVQVASVQVRAEAEGPDQLASETSTSGQASAQLTSSQSWCQYIHPDLPSDAIAWRVTRVEFYCVRGTSGLPFQLTLYEPSPANWPSATEVDSVTGSSSSFSSYWAWQGCDLTGETTIDSSEGICIALTTSSATAPLRLAHLTSGVNESNAALISGSPDWDSYSADQALRFRLYGEYITDDAECEVIEGTWEWGALP